MATLAPFELLRPGSYPASGLGGDPFQEATARDSGFWSMIDASMRPTLGAGLGVNAPITRHLTAGQGTYASYEWSLRYQTGGRELLRGWRGVAEIWAPEWSTEWRGDSGGLHSRGVTRRGFVGLQSPEVVPGLRVQITAPISSGTEGATDRPLGIGARLNLPRLLLQLSATSVTSLEPIHSTLSGAIWSADLNLVRRTAHGDVRVLLPHRLSLVSSLTTTELIPRSERTTREIYEIVPEGWARFGQVAVELRETDASRTILRWTGGEMNVRGDGAWGGQRFGHLNYARGHFTSLLAGHERKIGASGRIFGEIEVARSSSRARTSFETWPFTSTVIDLLGPRRIYKGQAHLDWGRLHVAAATPLGREIDLRGGFNWYDLRPRGEVANWRPDFLVFGSADREVDILGVWRVQIGTLSAGTSVRTGSVTWSLDLEQAILARASRHARGSTGSGGGGTGTEQSERGGWPGGSVVRLAVARAFG